MSAPPRKANKLKAFSFIGGRKKTTEKRREDKDSKKKRDEEKAAEEAIANDAKYFEEPKSAAKQTSVFVRGETVVIGNTGEAKSVNKAESKKQLYTLTGIKEPEKKAEPKKETPKAAVAKKKKPTQQKSSLELFAEELKKQNEKGSRKRPEDENIVHLVERGSGPPKMPMPGVMPFPNPMPGLLGGTGVVPIEKSSTGSYPTGNDTTNLYVGNLSPQATEEILCMEFGEYGPLASVKIMWPRTPEEHARARNCGFVAFMERKDAAVAIDKLDGKDILGYIMRVNWGKAVSIPMQPFYVHKKVKDEIFSSGLPFNARPSQKSASTAITPGANNSVPPPGQQAPPQQPKEEPSKESLSSLENALRNSEVHVIVPKDINVRRIIHRTIENVVMEGFAFENMILRRMTGDPRFEFLYNYKSPEHIYYRWKLYSILQGDDVDRWSTSKFRMYERGSFWIPPSLEDARVEEHVKKGQLKARQRDELEEILRSLDLTNDCIKKAMGFCIDNCDAAPEIVECITESLCILETPIQTKIARFFVVSDILNNTAIPGATFYRTAFEVSLPQIIGNMNSAYRAIPARMRAEYFKKHVLNCINAWQDWALYPPDFLQGLKAAFMAVAVKPATTATTTTTTATSSATTAGNPGATPAPPLGSFSAVPVAAEQSASAAPPKKKGGFTSITEQRIEPPPVEEEEDIDGEDLDGEDIDGEDLDGDDIDGEDIKPAEPKSKWNSLSDNDDDDDDDDDNDSIGKRSKSSSSKADSKRMKRK